MTLGSSWFLSILINIMLGQIIVVGYCSMLGYKQTWLDFPEPGTSGVNCSLQQGTSRSRFLSAAVTDFSIYTLGQSDSPACSCSFVMIQNLNLSRKQMKK